MNNTHSRHAPSLVLGLALAATLCLTPSRAAVTPDGLAQTEVGQQQLQATTARIAGQLQAILGEFQRNGITGEDVNLLSAIHAVVHDLDEEDMALVVSLIQKAREGAEAGDQRSHLLEAFSTQKSVGLKLRQILLQYQRQQELAAIASRLHALAARQHTALRDTLGLAETAAGRRREWFSENQRIALQLQVSEQQSLRDEVAAVLERLQNWSADPDNESAALAADALSQPEVAALARALAEIVKDMETSRLLSAAGRQRAARSLLRELASQLLPPADELEALQIALKEVESLITRQTAARTVTRELPEAPAEISEATRTLGELVDDTDVTRETVLDCDIAAAEQILAAVGRMQEARGILTSGEQPWRARRLIAATQQDLALARLESARRLIKQRIDSMEKQRMAMADPISNLQQIREDVAELLRLEQELKSDAANRESDPAELRSMAPRQGDLGDRTGDAADRAALDSREAAEQINEAMSQMRKSQRSLGEGQNNPGAQQAAIDALSKALAALEQRIAELEAAQEELAQMEDLLARLIAIIEAQQALNAETARLARNLDGRPTDEVGREQNELARPTRDLQGDLPPSVPQAATYLADAALQMILASSELLATRPAEARPPQDEALENLLRAKLELERRLEQLRAMLGIPPDAASLEELAQMIREAQQNVNSAMTAEELAAMARDLQQAGRRIQPATSGRMGLLPRMIREPLQDASEALTEGSAAAEGGDQPAANAEAGRAQEALAAAAAALDLAMAGMGEQPGSGQGQGSQGRNPGQGQGRSRMPGSQAGRGVGDAGNFFGAGGANGPRGGATGSGTFIGLPPRERAALLQSQGERYPQEYAPMIEQYLKNLSDKVGEEAPR